MIPCVFSPGKESDAARVFPFMALVAPVVLGKASCFASLFSADGNKFIGSYREWKANLMGQGQAHLTNCTSVRWK